MIVNKQKNKICLEWETVEVYPQWLYPCFKNKKKNKTEGEEKGQEQEGKPVRPMVSCDLCYAISSYQCKLWIKEDFVKLKMIKKLNYENNVLATAYYQQIYMSNNKTVSSEISLPNKIHAGTFRTCSLSMTKFETSNELIDCNFSENQIRGSLTLNILTP